MLQEPDLWWVMMMMVGEYEKQLQGHTYLLITAMQ